MRRRKYISNWLSNTSVALVVLGGFQIEMPTQMRVFTLVVATAAFLLGLVMTKEGK